MKKLLGLLAAFGMTATATATVVACGDKNITGEDGSKEPTTELQYDVEKGLTEFKDELEKAEAISKEIKADIEAKLKKSKIKVTPTIKTGVAEPTPVFLNKLVTIKDVVLSEQTRAEQVKEGKYKITFNKVTGYDITTSEDKLSFEATLKVSETIILDKAFLEEQIKNAETIITNPSQLEGVSINGLKKVLEEAKKALNEDTDQNVINNAANKLEEAIEQYNDAVKQAEKEKELAKAIEELNAQITSSKSMLKDKESSFESYKKLDNAIKTAEAKTGSKDINEVKTATSELKAIANNFESEYNKESEAKEQAEKEKELAKAIEELNAQISSSKIMLEGKDQSFESYKKLDNAIKTAEAKTGSKDINEVKTATSELKAIANNFESEYNKESEVKEQAEKEKELAEVKAALIEAINKANSALNENPNKTEEAKNDLNKAIAEAEKLKNTTNTYEIETVKEVTKKLEESITKYVGSANKPEEQPGGEDQPTNPGTEE